MGEATPDGWRTRGQATAVASVRAMLAGGLPHAILLVGPSGSGKTTLAFDLASALLCGAADAAARPCRACRACRMVEHGNHPDLHRLEPEGPGNAIGIGGPERGHGVRDLVSELALMPVEGGARVALVGSADRMTEDAQSAFLKTLEEPPAGTTIVLCADEEMRLLPTIRSRCARVRLGPVGIRAIEALLGERGVADAPTAARLSRISAGRPGAAMTLARAPDAVSIRAEIARRLLDLAGDGRATRLRGIRELQGRAAEMLRAIDAVPPGGSGIAEGARGRGARAGRSRRAPLAGPGPDPGAEGGSVDHAASPTEVARVPAAERRRAALALIEIWRDVTRDLALASLGELRMIRDPSLRDDLEAAAVRVRGRIGGGFLARLARAGELIEGNVSPELTLDVLSLTWVTAG